MPLIAKGPYGDEPGFWRGRCKHFPKRPMRGARSRVSAVEEGESHGSAKAGGRLFAEFQGSMIHWKQVLIESADPFC